MFVFNQILVDFENLIQEAILRSFIKLLYLQHPSRISFSLLWVIFFFLFRFHFIVELFDASINNIFRLLVISAPF